MLSAEIWRIILYYAFVGQDGPDLQTLDYCRKVCKTWKDIIEGSVWPSPTKEWGIITKSLIERKWVPEKIGPRMACWELQHIWDPGYFPSDNLISRAISLGKIKKDIMISMSLVFSFGRN